MPGTTALQAYSYPLTTDQAAPTGIQSLAQQVEKQVVAIFASTTTRDSQWTAATGLADGALCFITATGELQLRSAGAWVVVGGRANPYASAAGLVGIAVTAAGTSGTATVTFPTGRFSQAPNVYAQTNSLNADTATATNLVFSITTTSCTVGIYHGRPGTGTWSTSRTENVFWEAQQMTSSAAAG